jgi:hypothetical protein
MLRSLRTVAFALLTVFSVAPLFADEPAGCQTCRSVMTESESTLACTAPENGDWGYETCSTGVRQGLHGDVHWCRTGGGMCYYFEVY